MLANQFELKDEQKSLKSYTKKTVNILCGKLWIKILNFPHASINGNEVTCKQLKNCNCKIDIAIHTQSLVNPAHYSIFTLESKVICFYKFDSTLSQIKMAIKFIFYFSLVIIIYSYVGYGLLLLVLVTIKKLFNAKNVRQQDAAFQPPVTIIIAAYNEADFIEDKIKNTLALDYPSDKLKIIIITDGSTDKTPEIVARYPSIRLLHQPGRSGKIAAMHRAMGFVNTPFVIYCDANTYLNTDAIKNIVRHYADKKVGGVAGEKKIMQLGNAGVSGAGEGLYWKYESTLKQLDSNLYTVVGAAGELFSVRTELYEFPGENVLLDDFIISLRICARGYRVAYEKQAYAMETASANLKEERKRKIRISAGAFQSMLMLKGLLNVFKHPMLTFQYVSHRVLRWTLCPLLLPLLFISNILLLNEYPVIIYQLIFAGQLAFYGAVLAGWLFSLRGIKVKILYFPYYFFFINLSLYLGFFRFLKGNQSVLWEKAVRKKVQEA
jgi:Glycosyltransferases, probably involved in cell wall biogenesis